MKVLLIYGGASCEHDISVITGCLAAGFFHSVCAVYLDQQNRCFWVQKPLSPLQHSALKTRAVFLLGEGKIGVVKGKRIVKKVAVDVAVNCCHGRCGEDGCCAALCKLCNLPLVGSDLTPSAVAMDKMVCKRLLSKMGYPVVEGEELTSPDGHISLPLPLVIKPCSAGSSIGVSAVSDEEGIRRAVAEAFRYDDRVVAERALSNFTELNCAAMRADGQVIASDVYRPFTPHEVLTFNDKYLSGEKFSSRKIICDEAKQMTKQIYSDLHFEGVIRVDYFLCDGKLVVNEINSVPGSLSYPLWADIFSPSQFGEILLREALARFNEKSRIVTQYASDVLKCGGIKK